MAWPGSVRVRITALATAVSALALGGASVLLVATLDRSLNQAGDDLAVGRVHQLAAQVVRGDLPAVITDVGGEGVAQVVDADGRVLAASPNIVGRAALVTGGGPADAPRVRVLHGAPDDAETENYRVWLLAVATPTGEDTVLAGASLESVSEASRTLRRDLALGVPLLVALVAAGTWVVVGRTLRPVEDIRAEVAGLGAGDLTRRVPVPPSRDEIARLAETMNQMLHRLDGSARRQREFVADASHELQSPLAALRTRLEVEAGAGGATSALAADLLADTQRMEALVRDLTALARETEGPGRAPSREVDLDDLVLEEVARARTAAPVRVDSAGVSAAPVVGDPEALRRLVRNVLENAVRHARSCVGVRLTTGSRGAVLTVIDDGPGVAPEDRERIFERFVSGDAARRSGTGTGLGLAIARAIAVRHGGTLHAVEPEEGEGGRFVLTLPTPVGGAPRGLDATVSGG